MQVSRKKSNVVASTLSVAVAIAQEVYNAAVKPAFHAKLLGSDLVGGAKRSTQQHQTRLGAFRCMRPQFLALRNAGADVQQMAHAAGAPMFLYSNENYGLSDTALHSSRTAVAASASSATCGKRPDLVLSILDSADCKLDPAFDGNIGPFKYWALAVWQTWFPTSFLQETLEQAVCKLGKAEKSYGPLSLDPPLRSSPLPPE